MAEDTPAPGDGNTQSLRNLFTDSNQLEVDVRSLSYSHHIYNPSLSPPASIQAPFSQPSVNPLTPPSPGRVGRRLCPRRHECLPDPRPLTEFAAGRSSTASLSSSLYQHVEENGRTYHRYKEGKYPLPNDEPEQDRLDFQHKLYTMSLDNNLYIAPISRNPKHVLDVATGTGIWAIEFAQEHPESNVLGTDLSPIQPTHAPPNVSFEICDAEDDWDFSTPFDFIHMRAIVTCFRDPRAVFASAFKALAPGGYLQLRDPLFPFLYHDPPPANCALKRWNELILEAGTKLGRKWTNAHNYRQWLEELGYRDVVEVKERLPLSPWAKGKRMKYLSLWLQHDMLSGLEGMSMALFTRVLGWEADAVKTFLVAVKKDIQDTSIHAYSEGVIVYGRKPFEGEE